MPQPCWRLTRACHPFGDRLGHPYSEIGAMPTSSRACGAHVTVTGWALHRAPRGRWGAP